MKAIEELSYEEAFQELEQIVKQLEKGDARSLQEALQLYERGRTLVTYCQRLLDQAELKVQQISEGKIQPFEEMGEENASEFAGE